MPASIAHALHPTPTSTSSGSRDSWVQIKATNLDEHIVEAARLVLRDVRIHFERSGRYVPVSGFEPTEYIEVGPPSKLFPGDPVYFNFLDANNRRAPSIHGALVKTRKPFVFTLQRPGRYEVTVRVEAGERWAEQVLYFSWEPGEIPMLGKVRKIIR